MEAIVVKDKNTWPPEVEEFLEQHKELLIDKKIVECEEGKIRRRNNKIGGLYPIFVIIQDNKWASAKIINEIYKKYNNKLISSYDEFVEDLSYILHKYSFLVVHYTRLTEYEIGDIKKNGLQLPNPEFLSERIDKLVEQKYLTIEEANELKEHNAYSVQKDRAFEFYFTSGDPFEGETDNSKEGYIIKLLCFWGGEALYCRNEDKPIGQILRKIGIPCILESIVPGSILSNANLYFQVVYGLKNAYLKNKNITHKGKKLFVEKHNYDLPTKKNITNDDMKKIKITRIIRYDENKEDFIRFTGCDKWDEQLTL